MSSCTPAIVVTPNLIVVEHYVNLSIGLAFGVVKALLGRRGYVLGSLRFQRISRKKRGNEISSLECWFRGVR